MDLLVPHLCLGLLPQVLFLLKLHDPLLLHPKVLSAPKLLYHFLMILLLLYPQLLLQLEELPLDFLFPELGYLLDDPEPILSLVYVIICPGSLCQTSGLGAYSAGCVDGLVLTTSVASANVY